MSVNGEQDEVRNLFKKKLLVYPIVTTKCTNGPYLRLRSKLNYWGFSSATWLSRKLYNGASGTHLRTHVQSRSTAAEEGPVWVMKAFKIFAKNTWKIATVFCALIALAPLPSQPIKFCSFITNCCIIWFCQDESENLEEITEETRMPVEAQTLQPAKGNIF